MEVNETLKHVMAVRHLNLQQLSDKSGVTYETLRNIYYDRIHDPKVSTMLKLSQALDLSINYLCGDMLYKDDEKEILTNYRKSSARGKAVIKLFSQVERHMTEQERAADKYIIPCLIPIGIISDGIKYHSCDSVKIETDNPNAFLAVEITTNNFAPAYCAGDRILLENRFPKDQEYAVFLKEEKAYFRQFLVHDNCYTLRCINGRGKDIHLKRMDEVDCIGTLSGIIRT